MSKKVWQMELRKAESASTMEGYGNTVSSGNISELGSRAIASSSRQVDVSMQCIHGNIHAKNPFT